MTSEFKAMTRNKIQTGKPQKSLITITIEPTFSLSISSYNGQVKSVSIWVGLSWVSILMTLSSYK
jgi:hypothetical protein